VGTVFIGPKDQSPTDQPISLTYGKYDDLRMPWVGRDSGARVISVTDTTTRVAEVKENRVWISIQNVGSNPCCIGFGEDAQFDLDGIKLAPMGAVVLDRNMPWADKLDAICGAGLTTTLLVCEVVQVVIDGRGE